MRLASWIAAAALVLASCNHAERGAGARVRRVLGQNRYWAKEGKADEVYAWRIHATDVQVQMGLPRGRVFRGAGGGDPDVVWQIELTPEQMDEFVRQQQREMATFQPVMDRMATLITRFESSSYVETEYRERAP